MTSRIAMVDGQVLPLESAKVSVLDRGFLYGDSIFETLRTYGGRPFALDLHLERLERSASLVHIDLPISSRDLSDEVVRAIAASQNAESYIRLTITRGSGELGLDPELAGRPLRVIIVTPLKPPAGEAYQKGIHAVSFRTTRAFDGTEAVGAKIGNYLVSVLAMQRAKAAGAGEALIVDRGGLVVEGASSNVFFVQRNALVTPPEEAGILPGITRKILLGIAIDLGITVEQRTPGIGDIFGFDEIFVTSSIRELLPVVALDGRSVGDGAPGPVYRKLLAEFRARALRARP